MNGWTGLQVDLSELVAAHLVYMNLNLHGHSSNIQCDIGILLKGIKNRKSRVMATLEPWHEVFQILVGHSCPIDCFITRDEFCRLGAPLVHYGEDAIESL